MFKSIRSRGSLYKWYSKAVLLKQEDPELFDVIAARTREASKAHGLDEESGVASFLRECHREGIDPREIHEIPDESVSCPACGGRSVDHEQSFWGCSNCAANGPVLFGTLVDLGMRGDPSTGDFERRSPSVSVARQLAQQFPDLAEIEAEPTLSERLDDAYFDWYFALNTTSFEIGDKDVEAAEAMNARNVLGDPQARGDDARFYSLTACSTAGWHWRRAEQGDSEPSAPLQTLEWLERYSGGSSAATRSEIIGLVAAATAPDEGLEHHSPGGTPFGLAFLNAGWFLLDGTILASQPGVADLHSLETFQTVFRFGVALRDAQVAYGEAA
jgi:hypothetical protein